MVSPCPRAWLFLTVLCSFGILVCPAVAQQPGFRLPGPGRQAEAPKAWNEAEYVFTATLNNAQAGPVARSLPPIHTHKLQFTVKDVLRGPLKKDEELTASHSARQNDPPTFPVGKLCLVSMSKSRGTFRAERVELATKELIAEVTTACSLPMGWTMLSGEVVSPWASLGDKAWAVSKAPEGKLLGSKTKRPALMTGAAVEFKVEKVPPKVDVKWSNPDGDGEYKITVSNPTDKPIEVPALLCQGDDILWDESLVILCQKKAYPIPGSDGVSGEVQALKLEPGKSVSTVVQALALKGPKWPMGGYRIEFRFCLGEKSQTMSFYYRSKHHDPIRDALSK